MDVVHHELALRQDNAGRMVTIFTCLSFPWTLPMTLDFPPPWIVPCHHFATVLTCCKSTTTNHRPFWPQGPNFVTAASSRKGAYMSHSAHWRKVPLFLKDHCIEFS
ncbi:hypothetical protein AMAG_18869 [Allomyces macrogynus ATCC 38327]|uniref:Uncharacterized protein n=1 Tax=Allomyces macrogynus (strain ATCC 38327) TaxID=578462 RepID=A0A0L0SJ16_ALLM3|nr:hypothetical protein AMAG_18869 [Allomyces macrogynus ATCC 38327]|eukprot:KNE62481.1 hypothetical protein AMAG_18869 [Allomyces macrogynus ATCC 38327]